MSSIHGQRAAIAQEVREFMASNEKSEYATTLNQLLVKAIETDSSEVYAELTECLGNAMVNKNAVFYAKSYVEDLAINPKNEIKKEVYTKAVTNAMFYVMNWYNTVPRSDSMPLDHVQKAIECLQKVESSMLAGNILGISKLPHAPTEDVSLEAIEASFLRLSFCLDIYDNANV